MTDADSDNSPTSASFGSVIRRLRKARQWSQADLGERLGVSLSTVSKLENGRAAITLDHLHQFALAFDTTPAALLAEEIDPREAELLRAVRSGDRREAIAALARSLEIDVDHLGVPDQPGSSPSPVQFETLGRNAAQLARSAASIVATINGTPIERLLAAWITEQGQ